MNKEKLHKIAEAIDISAARATGDKLLGRKGYISASENGLVAHVGNKSKRHYGSLSKKLSFMQSRSMYNEDIATFSLDRLPTSEEAELLRSVVGFKKKPALSNQRKTELENHARKKLGGR